MKNLLVQSLAVLLFMASAGSSFASDFIVESVAIRKSPLKAPYYMYFEVSYGDKKAAMSKPHKMSDPAMAGREVMVPLNLKLEDVPMRNWATVTIHIDPDAEKVKTFEASHRHTARVPMTDNAVKPQVIMPKKGVGEYVVRARGVN